jgi:protein tyrosine/serine phosphatase
MEVPFPDSYWVEPGLLLAGEYPSELSPELTRLRLRRMLDLGIRQFIDLTQPELTQSRPYRDALAEVAQEMGVKDTIIFNYPIPDLEIPARDLMRSILDTLDKAVSGKFPIYVHCWAGIGRTGTVVGCYLVRHGMTGDQALEHIQRLRANVPGFWYGSPETSAQRDYVRTWVEPGKFPKP